METPKVVTVTPTNKVIVEGQSSQPFLKEKKEPFVEDISKETLETVKEKVSKLQATMDLQDQSERNHDQELRKITHMPLL